MGSGKNTSHFQSAWQKLKIKWQIENNFQLILILVVFGLTGFTAAFLKALIFQWMGMNGDTPVWVRTLILLLILIPLYKALLITYGTLFGQFRFFKNFILKFLTAVRRLFSFQMITRQ